MKNAKLLTQEQIVTLTRHLKLKHRLDALYYIRPITPTGDRPEISFIGDIQLSDQVGLSLRLSLSVEAALALLNQIDLIDRLSM